MSEKEQSQLAKDYFYQIRKTDRLIQRLAGTVSELRSGLAAIGSELRPNKIRSSAGNNSLEDAMCRIDELERKINARIDELATMKQEAFDMIGRVPDFDQQNVLIGRYIQMAQWEEISDDLGYSQQWVYEIHGKALLAFFKANAIFFENRVKQSGVAC